MTARCIAVLSVSAGGASWKPTSANYIIIHEKQFHLISDINAAAGKVGKIQLFGFNPPQNAFARQETRASGAAHPDAVWKGVMEFDWTNPEHVFMRVSQNVPSS